MTRGEKPIGNRQSPGVPDPASGHMKQWLQERPFLKNATRQSGHAREMELLSFFLTQPRPLPRAQHSPISCMEVTRGK